MRCVVCQDSSELENEEWTYKEACGQIKKGEEGQRKLEEKRESGIENEKQEVSGERYITRDNKINREEEREIERGKERQSISS